MPTPAASWQLYGVPYAVTSGRWRSEPLSVAVRLSGSNGFDNEVTLSIDPALSNLPAGAQVTIADTKLRVRSDISTTLRIALPDSGESMAGSYTVVVKAQGGGVTREGVLDNH